MKNFLGASMLAIASLVSGVPVDPQTSEITHNQDVTQNFRLGKEAVAEIRQGYTAGQYDAFLKEMDAFYEQVTQDHRLQEFSSLREGVLDNAQWNDSVKGLQKQKNKQLTDLADEDSSLFGEKLRSVAKNSTDVEDEALFVLASIRQMPLDSGKSRDENTLIALDVEYECKSLHLNQSSLGKNSNVDPRIGQYVLKMQQMDKMLLASESFDDAHLKQVVQFLGQTADQRMAKNWDSLDLQALVMGKIQPVTRIQEKTISILQMHQESLSDLYSQHSMRG